MVSPHVPPIQLLALATAVPPHVIEQDHAAEFARIVFGDRIEGFSALAKVFETTGIERRYTSEPVSWFEVPHGWTDRALAYLDGATELFSAVAASALRNARLEAAEIDAIVTVSSTGIATPSLEARVSPRLGFRSDVARVPIFGLGCAAGVTGTAIASRLAAGRPGTNVLLVNVELCSLAFRSDRATKMDIISTALFADGAAAAIFRCEDDRTGIATVTGSTEHLWADTIDIMGWSVDPMGLGVLLSRSLPGFIAKHYRTTFDRALERIAFDRDRPAQLIMHPGGTKVIESFETALELQPGTLALERSVMRDYGNMSSPTVLFVLERAIAAGMHGPSIMAALGPGFTATFVGLDIARP